MNTLVRFKHVFNKAVSYLFCWLVDIDERGRVQGTHHSAQQESRQTICSYGTVIFYSYAGCLILV